MDIELIKRVTIWVIIVLFALALLGGLYALYAYWKLKTGAGSTGPGSPYQAQNHRSVLDSLTPSPAQTSATSSATTTQLEAPASLNARVSPQASQAKPDQSTIDSLTAPQ